MLGDDRFTYMIDYLNSFRYSFWFPDIPIERSGFEYDVGLHWSDKEWTICLFTDNAIRVRGICF